MEVPAPTDEALQAVLHKIITRLMKLLTRKGVLVEEQGQACMADDDADSDEARVLRPWQAAACTSRIAFGQTLSPGGRARKSGKKERQERIAAPLGLG